MKKILLLLLIIPTILYAECNEEKHKEYSSLAANITYDNSYSKSTQQYEITIFNLFEGLYVKYNKDIYRPDENSEVVIKAVPEGTHVYLEVYAEDGCKSLKSINISEPYYNPYYTDYICKGYQDTVAYCYSQFTTSKVTKENVQKAIDNYNKRINQQKKQEEVIEEDNSLFAKIKAFVKEWGIKIGLTVATIIISSTIYNAKFRKIKHGI